MNKQYFSLLFGTFFATNTFAAVLTPNDINKFGNLPGKYNNLVFKLSPGNWVKTIRLPNSAQNNATIRIISTAKAAANINTSNLLFASSYTLHTNSNFLFRYKAKLKKWVPVKISAHELNANNNLRDDVNHIIKSSSLNAPKTQVKFSNKHWVSTLALPQQAKNRDRVIFTSTTKKDATILNRNTNTQATLRLQKGDRYEFMYVSNISQWVLMSSPKDIYQARNLGNQQIPNMTKPNTLVKISDGNWQAELKLPLKASIGDKVVFDSTAAYNTTITARNGLKKIIQKNEKQRYLYTTHGWVSDSSTINILLVSDPAIAEKLGATAAKLRLYESINITNNTAERSNAQFYVRPVKYLTHKVLITNNTLGNFENALDTMPYDPVIIKERQNTQADSVFYEITNNSLCGLGRYAITPLFDTMFTVGSTSCDLTTMDHELGHNLGLDHEASSEPPTSAQEHYNKAYSSILGASTMSTYGGKIMVYTSPKLYSYKYGLHLGSNTMNQVKVLNRTAAIASKIY